MLTRALLLFGLIAVVTAVAIVVTVPLPEIPLLRYAALAAPLIGALVVVIEWHEAGAALPALLASVRQPSPTTDVVAEARAVCEGPPSTT